MKIELLNNSETWVVVHYTSKEELLEQYSNTVFVTNTDEHNYYASVGNLTSEHFLFRISKPLAMTKKEAEERYCIKIEG